MNHNPFSLSRPLCALSLLVFLLASGTANAQNNPTKRLLGYFLSQGGYFLSNDTGKAALGDVKFLSYDAFYGRPHHFGRYRLSGGLELFSLSDHFFPFTGGNSFNMIGPSFRVATSFSGGTIRPFLSAGYYISSLSTDRTTHISTTSLVPGATLGVDFKLSRYLTLTTGYRFNERVGGVSTDGFLLNLRVF